MVRKERLELSHPKILEPKSSASTNSATPALSLRINQRNGSYFKLFIELQFNSCRATSIKEMVAKTGFEPVTPSL